MILVSLVAAVATPTATVTAEATGGGGGGSEAQAAATLTAAIIAAAGVVVVAVISIINTNRSLKQSRRDQWWQQFQWAIEKALSHDQDESDVGSAVVNQLVMRKEATEADNEIALTVADLLTEREQQARKFWGRKTKP